VVVAEDEGVIDGRCASRFAWSDAAARTASSWAAWLSAAAIRADSALAACREWLLVARMWAASATPPPSATAPVTAAVDVTLAFVLLNRPGFACAPCLPDMPDKGQPFAVLHLCPVVAPGATLSPDPGSAKHTCVHIDESGVSASRRRAIDPWMPYARSSGTTLP
jgi:hypothetical protein